MAEFRSSRGMLMSMEIAMVAASQEDSDQNDLCAITGHLVYPRRCHR